MSKNSTNAATLSPLSEVSERGKNISPPPVLQLHLPVRVPGAGVRARHLRHPHRHHVHPPLELRGEQQEEGQHRG